MKKDLLERENCIKRGCDRRIQTLCLRGKKCIHFTGIEDSTDWTKASGEGTIRKALIVWI